MLENLLYPAGFKEEKSHIESPDRVFRVYHLTMWPAEVTIDWLQEMFMMPDVDVSVHVIPKDRYKSMQMLNEMVTRAKAHYELELKKGSEFNLPELEAVWQDAEALRRSVQRGHEKIFEVAVIITVYADSQESLKEKCTQVENILASRPARLTPCFLVQKQAYNYALPLGMHPFSGEIKKRHTTLGGAMSVLPLIDDAFSHPDGAFLGRSASGAALLFNPFIGPPELPNPHLGVFGCTGAGKSVTLKVLSARLSLLGVKILVIDWEGEYERMCLNLCGGKVIKIDPSRLSGINPFEIEPEIDEGREILNISDKINDIRSLIAAVIRYLSQRTLTAHELAALEEAVREDFRRRGITTDPESLYHRPPSTGDSYYVGKVKKPLPTFSSFYEILITKPGAENLAIELKPFLKGNTLGIFDCESEIDPDAPVTVIDISRIRDEFTRFYAMYVVLNWAWHRFAVKPGNKIIVNDEAWMFMKYPESAFFLESLARRGRKRQTGLVIASQHIEEFLKSEEGKAVLSSCASKILLQQTAAVIPEIINTFSLPPSAAGIFESFSPGEGLLQVKDSFTRVRIEVMPFEMPHVKTG